MKRLALLTIAIGLFAAACSPGSGSTTTVGRANFVSKALVDFEACDDFLDYVHTHALELVGPYGLNGFGFGFPVSVAASLEDADFAAAESAAPGATRSADAFSTTNVQEVGVDEPDIVKTDGNKIIAIANNRLHYIEIAEDGPRLRGTMQLDNGWASELFLSGDKAIVMTNGAWVETREFVGEADFIGPAYSQLSQLLEIDLSNPDKMKVTKILTLDGRYISARMVGDTARIVVSSQPTGLVFTFPEGGGLRSEREAARENRQVILDSTEDNWIPYFVLEDMSGPRTVTTEGPLFGCGDASHPDEFSGLGMLTILTIDMDEGLNGGNSIGLVADADTVYASTDNLYVATQRWQDWEQFDTVQLREEADRVTTQIHKFDITETRAEYRASGTVIGFMLNQWSVSEHNGDLRVATTTGGWWDQTSGESYVTVLREDDGELRQIGQVDGLGKGEQIYAVRYMGDVGYVVTFRQTDPLYTIDLADPTNPTVMGELKILGYSAYLHPLDDNLLLGIGQDATEEGRTLGTQVSVFDISDLANPTRLHNWTLKHGFSEVEYDHRAFLHWAPTGLTMLPVQTWEWDEKTRTESYFAGAQALTVDREKGISLIGTVSHQPDKPDGQEDWYWMASIRRSIVIGDTVYTVSDAGIEASDIDTLEEISFIRF